MGEKRGQSWSIDLILAAAIFILVVTGFYALIAQPKESTQENLKQEAQKITSRLDARSGSSQQGVIVDGAIDEAKLTTLSQQDYDALKRQLGATKSFCIYLEDEQGRLIPINGTQVGVGGTDILVNGVPCNGIVT